MRTRPSRVSLSTSGETSRTLAGARTPSSRAALPGAPRAALPSQPRPWLDDLAAPPCNAVADCGARGDGRGLRPGGRHGHRVHDARRRREAAIDAKAEGRVRSLAEFANRFAIEEKNA